MEDIAARAGVSRTTASLVLNNRQAELRISNETRQRILDAVNELGYRRNELARAVGSGKNYVLGFLKMGAGEQELRLLEGVLKATTETDYLLKVLVGSDASHEEIARHCVGQRLAGIVTRSFSKAEETLAFFKGLEAYGIPVVYVDDNLDAPEMQDISCVTTDDEHGYRMTVAHLVELGHRNIAFIAGNSVHPQDIQRKESYRRMMAEYGLDVPEGSVRDADWDLDLTEHWTRHLFAHPANSPTALICAGDKLAAVAIRTLWEMGVRVPEDVSVIGYSDFSYAELLYPALTTIAQPFVEMGAVATRILLQRLQEKAPEEDQPTRIALPTQLIVRKSTATVPARPSVGH